MKKILLKYLLPDEKLWRLAGHIAERFYDKDDGAYDILQDKLFYWIKDGLYDK